MGSKLLEKKRKAREPSTEESDDELADGAFDGVLSQSEDEDEEFDDVISAGEDDEDESDFDGSEGEEGEGEDGSILSDDIPSDIDGEDAIGKLLKDTEEMEITEPGVDPKRKEESDEELPYRIEKDANGNDRYVYDEIDPVYDSDDSDAQEPANTIGNIPLSFYDR